MRRLLIVVLSIVLAAPAWAQAPQIAGADAPAFVEARAAWLDGDDLVALQALKSLSEGGNTAAQILLARIAEEPHMHRQVTGDMSRADRLALLRQPGGVSGTSWLEAARDGSALAVSLIGRKAEFTSAQRADGTPYSPEAEAAVEGLLAYGEVDLATEVAYKLYDGNFLRPTLDLLTRYQAVLDPISEPV